MKKQSPIAIMAIIGILFIALFLGVIESGIKGSVPGSRHYNNKNDEGYYVFLRMLEEVGLPVKKEREYTTPKDKRSTIVYVDGREDFYGADLENWVGRGNTLVLIGQGLESFFKGATTDLPEENLTFEIDLPHPNEANLYADPVTATTVLSDSLKKAYPAARTIAHADGAPVISKSRYKKGHFIFVADGELFANHSMQNVITARLLTELFAQETTGPIYLRERSGEVLYSPSIIKGVFTGRISWFTLQLALIFGLFLLKTGKRFARPEILEGKKQRKFTEHIKGVGLFYQRTRAYSLIEKIDSEYFKTVICRGKKPSIMDQDEFDDLTEPKTGISDEQILDRYKRRENTQKDNRSHKGLTRGSEYEKRI